MADLSERVEPSLTYENIEDVLIEVRKVAEENYQLHQQALIAAKTIEERNLALEGLNRAASALTLTDNALKSAITSGSEFRAAYLAQIQGNPQAAVANNTRAAMNMRAGAQQLDQFSDYVPTSRFMAGALSAVKAGVGGMQSGLIRADAIAANVEAKASEAVVAFSRGLKAFAKGMTAFAQKIAATPEKVKLAVQQKAADVSEAVIVTAAHAEVMVRMQVKAVQHKALETKEAVVDKVNEVKEIVAGQITAGKHAVVQRKDAAVERAVAGKDAVVAGAQVVNDKVLASVAAVKEVEARTRQNAWATINRFADAAVQVKHDVTNAVEQKADTVERHAKAVMGVTAGVVGAVGGMFRQFGRDMAARYSAQVEAIAAEQAQRKVPQGAAKSVARLLSAYETERAPLALALKKANVIALGYSGTRDVPNVVNVTPEMDDSQPQNMLRHALLQGDAARAKQALQQGASVDVAYAYTSAQAGATPVVAGLVEHASTLETLKMVLDAGANPNPAAGAHTAPPLASVIDRLSGAERVAGVIAMLNHGADPNARASNAMSPLVAAIRQGDVGVTNVLLDAGAKVDAPVLASFVFLSEHKLNTAETPDVRAKELRIAEGLIKGMMASDGQGVTRLLADKTSNVGKLIEERPEFKAMFDRAQQSYGAGAPAHKDSVKLA